MTKYFRNLITLIIIFLFCAPLCSAQNAVQDSIVTDTSDITTRVIRLEQKKVKNIRRGVKLRSLKYAFNSTKPLLKKPKKYTRIHFWNNKNELNVNLSEVAFVNWNAGGNNSISTLGNLNFVRNYKFRYISWENELRLGYGINAQEGEPIQKTDDFIRFASTFGFRRDTLSNWYYSAKMNFNTQFANGFRGDDRTTPISKFMAPGYLFVGAGISLILEEKKFNLYISPFTQKATFVLDEELSSQGAFGVENGRKVFMEVGFLVTSTWQKEVAKNVLMNTRLDLYSDYIRSFGNIDVNWELDFALTVNKYIKTNIQLNLIYDDDVRFDQVVDDDGTVINPGDPRIQLKQFLGVGLNYLF